MSDKMPTHRPMKYTFGGPVPLEDIVGRDEDVARLWEDLERASLVLTEVRRFGKTTTLRLMQAQAPDQWVCIRTTVQDARTTKDLVERTLAELMVHAGVGQKVKGLLRSAFRVVTPMIENRGIRLDLGDLDGRAANAVLLDALASVTEQLRKDNKRLAILWDEFPDAIRAIAKKEGPEAAQGVLALFRVAREREECESVRWVLTGSVGFHHVLAEAGTDRRAVNDLLFCQLEPLSHAWTTWLATCLLLGIGGPEDEGVARLLATRSGGIPFVLVIMVREIENRHRGGLVWAEALPSDQRSVDRLLVDAALHVGENWAFLLERVGDYYGENTALAEAILDVVASGPRGLEDILGLLEADLGYQPDRRTVGQVLRLLGEDHYLVFDPDSKTHTWRHKPLRVIWRTRRQTL